MAGIPPIALLLGVGAAALLLRKKEEPVVDGEEDVPGSPEDPSAPETSKPSVPKAKSQEELNEEQEDAKAGTHAEVRAGLKWSLLPGGYDIPQEMEHNELWVSEDCEASAVGRDWNPVIERDGKLYDPASFWREYGNNDRPNSSGEQRAEDSTVMQFVVRAIHGHRPTLPCKDEVPLHHEFEDWESYNQAWTDLRNGSPGITNLFDELYINHVKEPMMAAWADADEEAWTDYKLDEMAAWSIRTYPNESVGEQTDQAYFKWIEDDGNAPQKIDVNNPQHDYYKELWMSLREAIQNA